MKVLVNRDDNVGLQLVLFVLMTTVALVAPKLLSLMAELILL